MTNFVRTELISKRINTLEDKFDNAGKVINDLKQAQEEGIKLNDLTIKELKLLAEQQKELGEAVETITELLPYASWLVAELVNAIEQTTNDLTIIINEYLNGRVATQEMARLINLPSLAKYRGTQQTEFDSIISESDQNLRFRFTLKEKSKDTFVYRVGPFSYIEDLTTEPILVEYKGADYLIYNKTNNCIKAIDQPHQIAVMEECTQKNREDNRLKIWSRTKIDLDDDKYRQEPKVQRAVRANYIYCYQHKITIDGEIMQCPPYTFKLPSTLSFETNGIKHSALNRTTNARLETFAIDNVQTNHFLNETEFSYEVKLIDSMRNLNNKMKEVSKRHELASSTTQTHLYLLCAVIVCLLTITITLGCIIICRPKMIHKGQDKYQLHKPPARAPPLPPYNPEHAA